MLGILRWVMVVIFVTFGIQKFTPHSAEGIAQYIRHSPFVAWLSVFGVRGEANLLGVIELSTAALLAIGAFSPLASAVGSLMGIGTFLVTWSFFFTTPGAVRWSVSADPIAWNLTGEFLFKDIVLLCVCAVLLLASLARPGSAAPVAGLPGSRGSPDERDWGQEAGTVEPSAAAFSISTGSIASAGVKPKTRP